MSGIVSPVFLFESCDVGCLPVGHAMNASTRNRHEQCVRMLLATIQACPAASIRAAR
jgi:hypothetical protein